MIGDITSKSGQYSICPPSDVGLNLAIKEINAKGGVKVGDKSYQLKFDSIDDQSDTAQSSAAARKLLQDGAKFVFGPCGSGAASVLQLTKASKVVLISSASSAAAQIKPGGEPQFLLTGLPSVTDRVGSVVSALRQFSPNAKKLVMVGSDDPTWNSVIAATKDQWKNAGETLSSVAYPPGSSDLSGFLAKVKGQNPDAVYIGQNPQSVTLVLQQLDAAGIGKNVVIIGHGTEASVAAKAGGRPYIAAPFSPGPMSGPGTNSATESLVKKYLTETHTTTLPAYAPPIRYFYDIMYILADAMTKAGSLDDSQKILDQVLGKDLNYNGALGAVSFTKDGFIRFPLVSTFVASSGAQTSATWKPSS